MATIAENLSRIQSAKTDIKTAIEAKGVTVPSSATIDTYATYVSQISGGGAATPSNLSDWTYDSFGKITSAVIRSGVTSLDYYNGFYSCGSLSSVTIPDSVTTIGNQAFNGCGSLETVIIYATNPPMLGFYVFQNTPIEYGDGYIYVPDESVMNYQVQWGEYESQIRGISEL